MKALALAAALLATPAPACEIALVLGIDVSGSVDPDEYALQMNGLAAALRDATVRDAMKVAEARVAVMQWSGNSRQEISADWRIMADDADIEALAAEVETAPRAFRHYSTAIGEALLTGAALLGEISGQCERQVIDISGDGFNNEGVEVERARDALVRGGVTINGLAIEIGEPGLTAYYRRHLIGGPGAFVLTAKNFEDYPRAIRRKLLRELTDKVVLAPGSTSFE